MKDYMYMAVEGGLVAIVTAGLLGTPELGGAWVVVPIVVVTWVTLQLVSSVAFCNAINKGRIVVFPGRGTARETYGIAKGAKLGWLVKRHVSVYKLISEESATS